MASADAVPWLDFHEALKDSPRFRLGVKAHEASLAQLETKLAEVTRLCRVMMEFGKNYVAAFYNLMGGVAELNAAAFHDEPTAASAFDVLAGAYAEIVKFQKVLVEQAHWSIVKKLEDFVGRELGKVAEQRATFGKLSETLEEAMARKAAVSRAKEPETVFETANQLTAVGTCFAHTALDYAFQLNRIRAVRSHEILASFTSFLAAYQTFFAQGHQLFAETSVLERPKEALALLEEKSKRVERKMQDRHMLVPKEVFAAGTGGMSPDPDVVMEGYLFKRATNAFKHWHRRWFIIRNNQLLYCHRAGGGEKERKDSTAAHKTTPDGMTMMEADLRLCLVRPATAAVDRLCCFELVTPTKSHMLQADSESLCSAWVKALQRSIESAIHDEAPSSHGHDGHSESSSDSGDAARNGGTLEAVAAAGTLAWQGPQSASSASASPRTAKRRTLELVREVAGNERCADCGSANPKWASLNLGITLCIECCGIHRSLGVQVSKVRSLTLDAWEPEQLRLMLSLGNEKANAAWLRYLDPGLAVPPPAKANSSRGAREAWVKAKYVQRLFARPSRERIAEGRRRKRLSQLANQATLPVLPPRPSAAKKDSSLQRRQSCRAMSESVKKSSSNVLLRSYRPLHSSSPDLSAAEDAESLASITPADPLDSPRSAFRDPLNWSYGSESDIPSAALGAKQSLRQGLRDAELIEAAREGDVPRMLAAVAKGASVAARIEVETGSEGRRQTTTPLHQAMVGGNEAASEFLLQNGAPLDAVDCDANTPLHIAAHKGRTRQVCQLVKRGASHERRNALEETALDVAMGQLHVDIITVLRMRAELKDEIDDWDQEALRNYMHSINHMVEDADDSPRSLPPLSNPSASTASKPSASTASTLATPTAAGPAAPPADQPERTRADTKDNGSSVHV